MIGNIKKKDINVENDDKVNVKKICRRIKNTRRYSGKIRERKACPNCNSLDIAKRTTTYDYICYNCKWTGKDANRIMA